MAEQMKFPERPQRRLYSIEGGKGKAQKQQEEPPKKKPKRKKKTPKKRRKLRKKRVAFLLFLILLLLFFVFGRKNGTAVYVSTSQELMGVLTEKDLDAEALTATIENQMETSAGAKVRINEKIITEKIHIGGKYKTEVCTMEHLLPKIKSNITYKVQAAVISVDGKSTVIVSDREEAEKLLQKLRKKLLPAEGVSENVKVEWVEDVEVSERFVEPEDIMDTDAALKLMESTAEVTKSYTVEAGDTIAHIAGEYSTSIQHISELNPGAGVEKTIRVGQVINVPVERPRVSVKTVETQVLTAVEPKTTKVRTDDTKPRSYEKVIRQGKAGQKKSTIRITRINGAVVEEKEISKEIISEAVPEIIVKGTK